ncbi:MAG: HAD hydrolase family protein [Gammaproteobacteria bacterium]|nr:HAD hydrolase family protein [Gammaproteobacteria bacterium]
MPEKNAEQRAQLIKVAIFDVDGVLTDGSLILGDDGQQYKSFNAQDGQGLKLLQAANIEVGVITARQSTVVRRRMQELGIRHVYQGQQDKRETFNALLNRLGVTAEQVAYTGDDLPDLPLLRRAGLACTVANGTDIVKQHVHFIAPRAGGNGGVRDICEFILKAQQRYDELLARYLTD